MRESVNVFPSSGNIFADLGFEDTEEYLEKAGLVFAICEVGAQFGLTHGQIAKVLGLDQSVLAAMFDGHFHDISVERLSDCLKSLRDCAEAETATMNRRGTDES